MTKDEDIDSVDDKGYSINMEIIFKISPDYRLVENNSEAAFLICHDMAATPNEGWIEVNTSIGRWEEITYH